MGNTCETNCCGKNSETFNEYYLTIYFLGLKKKVKKKINFF